MTSEADTTTPCLRDLERTAVYGKEVDMSETLSGFIEDSSLDINAPLSRELEYVPQLDMKFFLTFALLSFSTALLPQINQYGT